MNRHAEKLVFHADQEAGSGAPGAGGSESPDEGIVEEFHTCTHCRYVLERGAR